jgi:hypothetical protein
VCIFSIIVSIIVIHTYGEQVGSNRARRLLPEGQADLPDLNTAVRRSFKVCIMYIHIQHTIIDIIDIMIHHIQTNYTNDA